MTQVPRGNDNESNPSVQSMGALVRELRESQGLTLAQLSSKAAVSSGLISQIEHGQGNPAYLTLLKLAQALSVPVGTFVAEPEQKVTNGVVRAGNRRRLEIADKAVSYTHLDVYKRQSRPNASRRPSTRRSAGAASCSRAARSSGWRSRARC